MKLGTLLVALMLGVMGEIASADSVGICYVHIDHPCLASPSFKPNVWHQDGDRYANNNAGRCIERAAEYKSWCRNPRATVTTIFQVQNRNVIGAVTGADGKTYLTDGVVRSIKFSSY